MFLTLESCFSWTCHIMFCGLSNSQGYLFCIWTGQKGTHKWPELTITRPWHNTIKMIISYILQNTNSSSRWDQIHVLTSKQCWDIRCQAKVYMLFLVKVNNLRADFVQLSELIQIHHKWLITYTRVGLHMSIKVCRPYTWPRNWFEKINRANIYKYIYQ